MSMAERSSDVDENYKVECCVLAGQNQLQAFVAFAPAGDSRSQRPSDQRIRFG